VLVQVAVAYKENEIAAASKLLASLDLRGKIVIGDAMQMHGTLGTLVTAGGDYIWTATDKHPTLRRDIEQLFAAPRV
jgi:predicted transposase YbfD/YdcC